MSGLDTSVAAAWQAALAAEQQADFGYAVLGPHLVGSSQVGLATTCAAAHETLVTSMSEQLAAADQVPVAPAADYPALYPVANASAAQALAVRLEDACAAAWRYLYSVTATAVAPAGLRAQAQTVLTASAVRATSWRIAAATTPTTVPFPGL